ncbi:nuclease domain-containing protein [Pigmentiphaga kullae]|uniref:Uncharacterized protein DUF1364 n=1 Tax=Pigmentiphaga kullae TaxID=151784 RepID=A0A4Q7NCD8_9BURK|nr:nuclease domain-containing protein [Pigmentiphaga kullae]RZS80636.1 uncharacterized protein DUF1364 [Pigmentiphaga kullae]
MKRTTPLRRKTPLRANGKPMKRSGPLKASRPRPTLIRQSARGESCTVVLRPGACWGTETTVWAHSNRGKDGKGAGLKANDRAGAYACWWCHGVYDRQIPRPAGMTLEYVEARFTRAMEISYARLVAKGLVPATPAPEDVPA